jgi:hypothetical protein
MGKNMRLVYHNKQNQKEVTRVENKKIQDG